MSRWTKGQLASVSQNTMAFDAQTELETGIVSNVTAAVVEQGSTCIQPATTSFCQRSHQTTAHVNALVQKHRLVNLSGKHKRRPTIK